MSHAKNDDGGGPSGKTTLMIWLGVGLCVLFIYLLVQHKGGSQPATPTTKSQTAAKDTATKVAAKAKNTERPPLQPRHWYDPIWELLFPKEEYVPPDPNYRDPNFGSSPMDSSTTPDSAKHQPESSATIERKSEQGLILPPGITGKVVYIRRGVQTPRQLDTMGARHASFCVPVKRYFKKWGLQEAAICDVWFLKRDGTILRIWGTGLNLSEGTLLDVLYIDTSGNEVLVVATLKGIVQEKGGKQ